MFVFFSLAPSLLFVNLGDEKQEIYLLWPYIPLSFSTVKISAKLGLFCRVMH